MDDTLSIIEDMLLLMKLCPQLDHERLDRCNVDDVINRIRDIRKQQEQDCLQEAEDTYAELQRLAFLWK